MSWFKSGPSKPILHISIITTVTAGIYLLRDSYRGKAYDKDVSCEGKVAIVTGGNSGIGKETARELAKRGATVYLLCRDKTRCDAARKAIVASTKNRYVFSRECDLGSLDSVKQFVDRFLEGNEKLLHLYLTLLITIYTFKQNRLDILINNAGVWRVPYGRTKDGFEIHLGVNHMGHFYLTNLLLDLLKKSAPSRIINVTSATHLKGKINKEDLNSEKTYSEIDAYHQSKLANILFTMELAERLKGTGVTANSVNPGISATMLYRRSISGFFQNLGDILFQPFYWVFFKTPVGGAQTSIYAAIDPDLEKVSGKYFENCAEKEVAPQAKDAVTAKWLWAVSEKWTKLKRAPLDESGNVTFS